MNITKKLIKEYVREKLASSDKWALKGLSLVYADQTAGEQSYGETTEKNNVGFTGVDGEFLSSLAKQAAVKGYLTPIQMKYVYKKMPKYWKQLLAKTDYDKLFAHMVGDGVVDAADVEKYIKKLQGKAFIEAL